MIRVCDLALRSAADSGAKVTEEANARFKEATRLLSGHSGRRDCLWVKIPLVFDDLWPSINSHSRRDLPPTVNSRMEIAKVKDSVQRDQPYIVEPTMTINFVLLQSPLPAPHDPEPVILSRERQFIRALCSIVILFTLQRSSMLVHPFHRFFGTLAVTRVVHVSTSSKTLTSICLSLQTRALIRPNFSSTHFKI